MSTPSTDINILPGAETKAKERKDNNELSQQERDTLVFSAQNTEVPALRKAFNKESLFRKVTKSEMFSMIEQIVQRVDTLEIQDKEKAYKEIIEKLRNDLVYVQSLNAILLKKVKLFPDMTWSLKTNKMEIVLKGTLDCIERYFDTICSGEVPEMYQFSADNITVLGNQKGAKGNSKETFFKTAILAIFLHFKSSTIAQLPGKNKKSWIDESSLAHVTPLPSNFNLTQEIPNSENCSLFFSDAQTEQGFVFTHSGYAFGGHRNEKRYPKGKVHGPEDCSSGVSDFTNCACQASTMELLFSYRHKTRSQEFIRKEWLDSSACQTLDSTYDPVIVRDPTRDIKPGDIYCLRRFKPNESMTNSEGVGGHTALIVGTASNGTMLTLGYNRDMPKLEGFGLQEFPYVEANPNHKVMIFRTKP